MAFPPWMHGCGQAAPGTHGAGRDLGNVDFGGGLWGCGRAGATSHLALWQEAQSRSAGPQHTCPCVSRPPPDQSVCGRMVADGLLYNRSYSFPLLTGLISNRDAAVPSSQHPFLGNLLFKVLGRL